MQRDCTVSSWAQGVRDVIRKVKACLELNLVRDVKDNKKCFCKYISDGRMTRESVGLLLNGTGALVTQDVGKAEGLIHLCLLAKTFRNHRIQGKVWSREDVHLVEEA
ncbi:hypothetical protein QYF61_018258 [Mycteria americana]|uniref:Uncharacterized protein n=1 Tax=Mycteria americana TaxID=33587 RepID=A0AAN7S3U7_MYCAM|nr:hypothetical protein QYF61_018258 [Mycteria americana]